MGKRRAEIATLVMRRTNGVIQSGPFAGMAILPGSHWGDGDITAKLLGLYEQELHGLIGRVAAGGYRAIVNIGSGEGFYAIGLALLCPALTIHAFDLSPQARDLLLRNATRNGVAERVQIAGACAPDDLAAIAREHGRIFVLSDCEGYEKPLFANQHLMAALAESDALVECHDFVHPDCTPAILAAFWRSHRVDIIHEAGRNPNLFPLLGQYSETDRWDAFCENRPVMMNWLFCRSRTASLG